MKFIINRWVTGSPLWHLQKPFCDFLQYTGTLDISIPISKQILVQVYFTLNFWTYRLYACYKRCTKENIFSQLQLSLNMFNLSNNSSLTIENYQHFYVLYKHVSKIYRLSAWRSRTQKPETWNSRDLRS